LAEGTCYGEVKDVKEVKDNTNDTCSTYENGCEQKGKETAPEFAECVAVPAAIEESAVKLRRNLAPFA
jgi:hypothetical protein